MAYKNIVNQNCAGFTEEFFQRLRDFVCKRNGTYDYSATGIGWTLHDSYYATDEDNCAIGDWYVISSVGELGSDALYFKIKWHGADHINIQGMLYWNAGTDTGYCKYPAADTHDVLMVDDNLAFPMWVYGDLDQIAIVTKPATEYYGAVFGKGIDPPYDETVATCSGALSSGNDITIVVDLVTSEWAVDRYLFIHDTAHVEKIKIKTLNVGTKTLTADLVNSYLANSKLAADMFYFCPYTAQAGNPVYVPIDHNGGLGTSLTHRWNSLCIGDCDPDKMNSEIIATPASFSGSLKGFQGFWRNILRMDQAVPGVNSEDVFTDFDSIDWRTFKCSTSTWLLFKEV
jgi:hypothetical protein